MDLDLDPTPLAICRLDAAAEVPSWALAASGPIVSVTRTPDELSVVVPEHAVPRDAAGVVIEPGWCTLLVRGPLPFDAVGVLASLAGPLAEAGVPIFVVSTYDTDVLLVGVDDVEAAVDAVVGAGHRVHR